MYSNYPFFLKRLPLLAIALCASLAHAQTQDSTYTFTYDAQGNLKTITDPLQRTTTIEYDALNRPKRRTDPLRGSTQIAYDALDQIRQITDPRNLSTVYGMNYLGDQLSLISPDSGSRNAQFDSAGNLIQQTDARGVTTFYEWDVLNRLTRQEWAGPGKSSGSAIPNQFIYDQGQNGIGRLTSIVDESGQTAFGYDRRGRVLSQLHTVNAATPKTFSVAYTYGKKGSSTGHLSSQTYPSGNRIELTYDGAGRAQSITLHSTKQTVTPLLRNISYYDFTRTDGWVWGNGSVLTRQFDLDGRLTHYPLGEASAGGLVRTVTYDAASRIRAYTHTGTGTGAQAPGLFNQSFDYDDNDRLTQFTSNSLNQTFRYDANGNRIQLQQGAASYSHEIAATSNQLLRASGPGNNRNFTWDAASNIQSDGTLTFEFALNGRMRSVSGPMGSTRYLYNALGQRVKKEGAFGIAGQDATYYVYDNQGQLLGEYDSNGNAIQETIYLDGIPVVVLKTEQGNTVPYYIYADHINTPRVITRASDNQMVWRWDNADPFGAAAPNENPTGAGTFTYNPRFPGQVFDVETGFHQNYYREYSPRDGKYLQSDPIGLNGGVNTYAYAGGNPLSKTDPLGLLEHFMLPLNSNATSRLETSYGDHYQAFSGNPPYRNNPDSTTQPNIGAAPTGWYYIVDRPEGGVVGQVTSYVTGKDKWFALYRDDGTPGDDTAVNGVLRKELRLHPKGPRGNSFGCVTLDNQSDFDRLRERLLKTKTGIIPGTTIKYYGTILIYRPTVGELF